MLFHFFLLELHKTELKPNLQYVWKWTRFKNSRTKFGVYSHKMWGPKLPILAVLRRSQLKREVFRTIRAIEKFLTYFKTMKCSSLHFFQNLGNFGPQRVEITGTVIQQKWQTLWIQKWYEIGCQLLLITNRKSHTGFWLVPTSMTLNNLERRNP